MIVRWLDPGDALATERDQLVVCVLCDGDSPSGLELLVERTPAEIPLLLLGHRPQNRGQSSAGREVIALRGPDDRPSASALAGLPTITGAADLVLIDGGARVPPGWVSRLVTAGSDPGVGTASPLYGPMLAEHASGADPSERDRRVGAKPGGLRPRVRGAAPHCLHVARRTLELIGGFPADARTLAQASAEISERCLRVGLVNVLADDLYVGADPETVPARGPADVPLDERTPLTRMLRVAQAAVEGLSVTIDARSLGPGVGGTQRYTFELAMALARHTDLQLRAVTAHDIEPGVAGELQGAGVDVISYEQAVVGVKRSHIVHRPQQVFSLGDLNLMSLLGQRSVITHVDLIAYHNPSYHADAAAFADHRWITRQALAVADRVTFLSEHSLRDALSEDLIDPEDCEVIGAAVLLNEGAQRPGLPEGIPRGRPYILCLGSDYRHKNRVFAIAVAAALRRDQGWTGQLVLAGGHVQYGSSREDEQQLMAASADVREAVTDLGLVSEGQRSS
ncbi:MAG: hypothetical protein ABI355_10785, partial [Solirubrobacteraceae bacterium]